MPDKVEIEKIIQRYNELIDIGAEELDIDLLREVVKLGIEFNLDVSKIVKKLNELTNEDVIHLK